ncbi:hypothetical protein ACHAQA_009821 [Verticillium albo-atrum]
MRHILLFLPFVFPALATPAPQAVEVEAFEAAKRIGQDGPVYIIPSNTSYEDIDEVIKGMTPVEIPIVPDYIGPATEADAQESSGFRANGAHTRVGLGTNLIDWGCDISMRGSFRDAANLLCNAVFCDEGRMYVRQVALVTNQIMSSRNLVIKMRGTHYGGIQTRDRFRDVIINVVNPQSSFPYDKAYLTPWHYYENCRMSRFSNFVHIDRARPGEHRSDWKINIELQRGTQRSGWCTGFKWINDIASSWTGPVGQWLGYLEAFCT